MLETVVDFTGSAGPAKEERCLLDVWADYQEFSPLFTFSLLPQTHPSNERRGLKAQTTTIKCHCVTSLLIDLSRGRVWLHAEVIS